MRKQFSYLLFLNALLLLSFNGFSQNNEERIFVCFGDYIFLPAEQIFPVGPGGGTCTPQLSSISIKSDEIAIANDLHGFTLQPTFSQTVEISSVGLCGGPGASNRVTVTKRYFLDVPFFCTSNIIREEITICKGETIFIPANQSFPIPPAGGGCTPRLSSINISPNIYAEADGLRGYNITPNTSMDFEVLSRGSCGAPGIGGNSDEIYKHYRIIVDESCTPVEEITICRGETVFLPAIQTFSTPPSSGPVGGGPGGGSGGPSGPPMGNCTPILSRIEISPTVNAASDELNGFNVTPITTTEYVVTSRGFCGGLHSAEVTDTEERKYKIIIDENCPSTAPPSNSGIFSDYPWLSSVVNVTDCEGVTVEIHQVGEQNYVFINTNESATLYNQNGVRWCTSGAGLDCIEFYSKGLLSRWTCGDVIPTTNSGPAGGPVSGPSGNTGAMGQPTLFSEFPWLGDIVSHTNCSSYIISIYQTGIYKYVYVESANTKILYNQNGELYCTSFPNYDCLSAYGLTNLIDSWYCPSLDTPDISLYSSKFTPLSSDQLMVYPNPAIDYIQIEVSPTSTSCEILLLDMTGKEILTTILNNSVTSLDISHLDKGVYFIQMKGENNTETIKVVRQ